MAPKNELRVEIYTDIVCPWCWLGKARLERALDALPDIRARVRYLPYELNPAAPEEGIDRMRHLTSKYGGGIAAMDERIAGLGREAGLEYHFESAVKIPNTFKAHRVVWLAGKEGDQGPVIGALHAAYFRDGKDIGDSRVLVEAASKGGLDGARVMKMLEGGEGVREVRELEEGASNIGISGVPFFLFRPEDGRALGLSGAHPVQTFLEILRECAG